MQEQTARQVAERIAAILGQAAPTPDTGPWLEDIHGDTPALRAARQMVRDLRGWKQGKTGWQDLTRSLLLYGPPGTGKSWIARAMGHSAGFSVVSGTFGQWQAAGHLGDMLREMRKTFAEARAKAPTVLIIDEIDAVGSREDRDRHNFTYKVQVINAFLAEMDSIAREEGVIVVGTCNHPDLIDPAVLRAGRFDMKVALTLPDADALFGVFRHGLPDWSESILRDLAARAVGHTPAEIDAAIRQARAAARGRNRDLTPDDLRGVFAVHRVPEVEHRIAIHECGHALACAALDLGEVQRVMLHDDGGLTIFEARPKPGLRADLEAFLTQLLAGRAAEQLVFGTVSGGAGGGKDSDLARATNLALSLHSQYGLGAYGPLWLGDHTDRLLPGSPALRDEVRAEIEAAEARALSLLTPHRGLLEDMAKVLADRRELTGDDAEPWLAKVRKAPTARVHEEASVAFERAAVTEAGASE